MSESVDDFLIHYGVKGMKWGKRSQGRLDRLNRVAEGSGSRLDKARVGLAEVSSTNRIRNGGLAGAAGNKAARMSARKDRIQKGEATVKDALNHLGGDRLIDIPSRKPKMATQQRSPGAILQTNQKRLAQLKRVGEGKGSRYDNLKVGLGEVSSVNRAFNGGLAGAARNKAARLEARDLRFQNGEAKVADVLNRFGGDRLIDLPNF